MAQIKRIDESYIKGIIRESLYRILNEGAGEMFADRVAMRGQKLAELLSGKGGKMSWEYDGPIVSIYGNQVMLNSVEISSDGSHIKLGYGDEDSEERDDIYGDEEITSYSVGEGLECDLVPQDGEDKESFGMKLYNMDMSNTLGKIIDKIESKDIKPMGRRIRH